MTKVTCQSLLCPAHQYIRIGHCFPGTIIFWHVCPGIVGRAMTEQLMSPHQGMQIKQHFKLTAGASIRLLQAT